MNSAPLFPKVNLCNLCCHFGGKKHARYDKLWIEKNGTDKVETRALNQAVKRNISIFPEKFCFQLTDREYENLKSQIVISNSEEDNDHGGRRTLPY